MGAVLAVPLALFSLAPAFQHPRALWLEVGAIADVVVGKPTPFVYRYHKFDGYLDRLVSGTVYVVTQDRQSFIVFSNVCTHVACGVRWEDDKKGFFCSCHNGLFDLSGKVVAGPAPRPLDRFKHKIEGGRLFIEVLEA